MSSGFTIAFEVSTGVTSFHWSGPGAVKVSTQYGSIAEAIHAFSRLKTECELIVESLHSYLQAELSSPSFKTEIPPPPPPGHSIQALPGPSLPPSSHFSPNQGPGFPGLKKDAATDPRLIAQTRPIQAPGGPTNTGKMPPGAALKLAQDMVAAYAHAQGRIGTSPPEEGGELPIVLPQAIPTAMKAEQKVPTHEDAVKEAQAFVNKMRAGMGLPPLNPDGTEEIPILPPPPPPESAAEVADQFSKSS